MTKLENGGLGHWEIFGARSLSPLNGNDPCIILLKRKPNNNKGVASFQFKLLVPRDLLVKKVNDHLKTIPAIWDVAPESDTSPDSDSSQASSKKRKHSDDGESVVGVDRGTDGGPVVSFAAVNDVSESSSNDPELASLLDNVDGGDQNQG